MNPTIQPYVKEAGPYKVAWHPCPHFSAPVNLKAPRAGVLHTTEGGFVGSEAIFDRHYAPHFLVGPGLIHQLVPIGYIGAALEHNNDEALVQIEMVGFSKDTPWTPDAKTIDTLAHLMLVLERDYGIPLSHPWPDKDWGRAGYDTAHRHSNIFGRIPGWYGHQDVPQNRHWDCGALQWSKIFEYAEHLKEQGATLPPLPKHLDGAAPHVLTVAGRQYYDWQIAVAKQIFAFFNGKDAGGGHHLQPCHAAAFVEMADAESSFEKDVWGDHESAYGLWQFHRDRLERICAKLGVQTPVAHGKAPPLSVEQQLEGAWTDITSPEEKAFKALEQLLLTSSAFESGVTLCRRWERAGAYGAMQKRGNGAATWLTYFTQHP